MSDSTISVQRVRLGGAPRLRRTERRGDASRRARLACELYAVRSRL